MEGLCADTPGVVSVQASGMMRLLRGADVNGNAVTALFMGRLSPEALVTRHQMEYSLYMLLQLFENEEWQLQGWVAARTARLMGPPTPRPPPPPLPSASVTYVETMEGFSLLNAMAMGRKVEQKDMREMVRREGVAACLPLRCCRAPLHFLRPPLPRPADGDGCRHVPHAHPFHPAHPPALV